VVAGSVIVFLLTAGVIGTTVGLIRAEERAASEQKAKDTAEKRLAQIEKGIDLLGSLFADLDPFAEEKEGRPLRAILGDRLDQAAAALDGEAVGDPVVVARLQDRLGQTYLGLGHAAKAEALFTKAVATRVTHLGPEHPDTLASRHHRAFAYERVGRRVEAVEEFREVHAARVRVLGADDPNTLSTLNELGMEHSLAGNLNEAIAILEQVRDKRVQSLGENADETLTTLQLLSEAYRAAKIRTKAIDLAEKVWAARVRKHGDDHPRAVAAMESLAYTYQAGYKMPQALELFQRARNQIVPKLGDYHPLTLRILHGLAHMHRAYRNLPEAISLYQVVRERREIVHGLYHPLTIVTLDGLASAYRQGGDDAKALPLLRQAAEGVERLAYAHVNAGFIIRNLTECYEALGQYDQAEVWLRKWVAVAKTKYRPEDPEYAGHDGLLGLGANLIRQKNYDAAEPILRESLTGMEKKNDRPWLETWDMHRARALLGAALLGQRKYVEAEVHLVQGYEGLRKTQRGDADRYAPSAGARVSEALERLVEFYDATTRPDESAKWRKELEAYKKFLESEGGK
jgi:tetratricopeptide (TPR) repeat protein